LKPKCKMPRKKVEDVYKKLTQLEHVLVRPDTYVGSVEKITQNLWVFDEEAKRMVQKDITFVPALYKIFDEILVNAADNKQRDPNMRKIEVIVDKDRGFISVKNDGRGIPVEIHKKEGIYVPELIFGNLLTSSNYNDSQKKTTGGRNGYGAKLANIFSRRFIIETQDTEKGLRYKQEWQKNMGKKTEPKITEIKKGKDFTHVTFYPDFKRFKMDGFDEDTIKLLQKRTYDIAGCTAKDVRVKWNRQLVPIKTFQEYVNLFLPEKTKKVYEKINDRWEVCISSQESGKFTQVSHVNTIWTMKGGQHCNHVADQLCQKVVQAIKRKNKGVPVKAAHVKNHLFLFVNCLIENPAFTSQTKEFLSSKSSTFGSKCELSENFLKRCMKTGVCENVLAWAKFRQGRELKKLDGKKIQRVLGIPKLDDANWAGHRDSIKSQQCTLILTEGDSAKALAVSGLSIVGRNKYGVFPLKGKLLNVRDASHKQIMNNAEVQNIRKIMGFRSNVDYSQDKNFKQLRYGHLMVMTDQDHDGSHIKGLVLNFIDYFWPSLLRRPGFLVEFITPIVVAKKGKQKKSFFTIPQYENWKKRNNNGKGWRIKYYKGLGTSTAAEAKQYFSDLRTHKKRFRYIGEQDRDSISLAFSKKRIQDRKDWLAAHKKGTYLDQSKDNISYTDFVNKELILFSIADCARSIPSLVDGLKPGQRKILFSCFKRNLKREIKVAQLAGYVSEHSAYHHGEASLVGTIVGMAANFAGSNNINLLYPSGQFGTRHQGGKDAASARYIYTRLCPVTRKIFHADDDLVVKFLDDDGLSVEPEYYVPVIPYILVNGGDGIGTGWSTSIPNYNPQDIIDNIRRMIRGDKPIIMDPWYKGWDGKFYREGHQNFSVWGNVQKTGDNKVEIDELPIKLWTDNYKNMLEKMSEEGKIVDMQYNHTDTAVSFTIEFSAEFGFHVVDIPFLKKMRLIGSCRTSNMVLFDAKGKLKRYDNEVQILKEFYKLRLNYYEKRKQALLDKIGKELEILSNKQRFIWMVVNDELEIRKKKKSILCEELLKLSFMMIHKEEKKKEDPDDEEKETRPAPEKGPLTGYDYLLKMPIHNLTSEKVAKIMQEKEDKEQELNILRSRPIAEIWRADLDDLEKSIEEHYKEQEGIVEKEKALLRKKKGRKHPTPKKKKNYTRKQRGDVVFEDKSKKKRRGAKAQKKKVEPPPLDHKMDPALMKLVGGFGFMDDSDDDDLLNPTNAKSKKSLSARLRAELEDDDSSSDDEPIYAGTKKPTVQTAIGDFFGHKKSDEESSEILNESLNRSDAKVNDVSLLQSADRSDSSGGIKNKNKGSLLNFFQRKPLVATSKNTDSSISPPVRSPGFNGKRPLDSSSDVARKPSKKRKIEISDGSSSNDNLEFLLDPPSSCTDF